MNHSQQLELLAKLVSIKSVYPDEARISGFIAGFLADLGFKVESVVTAPKRPNLVATNMPAPRYLGFYGHMDTVPPASDYVVDPFEFRIEDGRGRGLGSCDMKGGLSCILRLAAFAAEKSLPVKLVFGVDEEDISRGAHDLVSSGKLADLDFLIVAESGQVQDFSQDVSVCYGRKGRVVVDLEVRGAKAHAAEAHKGINAIERAAELIGLLKDLRFAPHAKLGGTSIVVQRIAAASDSFSVPDTCSIQLSLLTVPGTSYQDFEARFGELVRRHNLDARCSLAPRETPYGESYEIDLAHPFLEQLRSSVISSYRVDPIYTPSVADENVFAQRLGIPVLTIGPIGAGDHTAGEWVDLNSLDKVARIYQQAACLHAHRAECSIGEC